MKKFVYVLFGILLSMSSASAGEPMPEGSVLLEDSYVFTVAEAKGLMIRLSTLEKIVQKYKDLDQVTDEKFVETEDLLELKDLQIEQYKVMRELDLNRVKKLERRSNVSGLERWGLVGAGVGLTIGAILIADKIDDVVEVGSTQNNASVPARVTPLIRF